MYRLPAPLEAAAQSLKLAARGAVERTIESLGLAALAAGNAFARDGLLGAQFELNRKSAVFVLTFNDAFDERVMREAGAATAPLGVEPTSSWNALTLVEDHEVEVQISAERFAMDVAHACEWELREFNGYVAALLGYGKERGDPSSSAAASLSQERDRNPLRPEVIGHALMLGIDAVSDRADVRKVLIGELSRSLRGMLAGTYASMVSDMRAAGIQPLGMALRSSSARSERASRDEEANNTPGPRSRAAGLDDLAMSHAGRRGASEQTRFGHSTRAGQSTRSDSLGKVDPALLSLIKRLAQGAAQQLGEESQLLQEGGVQHERAGARERARAAAGAGASATAMTDDGEALPLNLIYAHRDALRQASHGSLDHMVIDVIAGLFDQILSDPKVPPQMARLIARLQLPVLRAALGDTSFFSSRRHPVRRFINRIASLGAGFENFESDTAQRFLLKVKALVQEVVEGDFDQVATYEAQLRALEGFMAQQASADSGSELNEAAELLSQKEDELQLRQLYAERLEGDLKGLAGPEFVREFISRVWSQVLLRAAERHGAESELTQRLRLTGRELYMSVQPKPTPAARKAFLADLPRLMQALTAGMNLVGWPEPQRREFFGQLMPAHAQALKSTGARQLDINLLSRQVEGALDKPLPSRSDLRAAAIGVHNTKPTLQASDFSADEATRLGLLDEAAVDWHTPAVPPPDEPASTPTSPAAGPVVSPVVSLVASPVVSPVFSPVVSSVVDPVSKGQTRPAAEPTPTLATLPAEPTDSAEPTQGRALADHVQVGFAYNMLVAGHWQKVRLSHVSASRSFFVFTHGTRHVQTISLTLRMLVRLCESSRLRAFENGYLVERATARARQQLADLNASGSTSQGLLASGPAALA